MLPPSVAYVGDVAGTERVERFQELREDRPPGPRSVGGARGTDTCATVSKRTFRSRWTVADMYKNIVQQQKTRSCFGIHAGRGLVGNAVPHERDALVVRLLDVPRENLLTWRQQTHSLIRERSDTEKL